MNSFVVLGALARLLGFLFFVLLTLGLWSRGHRFRQAAGLRQALRRAGQRFARGEIDEATYRRLRADLGSGVLP